MQEIFKRVNIIPLIFILTGSLAGDIILNPPTTPTINIVETNETIESVQAYIIESNSTIPLTPNIPIIIENNDSNISIPDIPILVENNDSDISIPDIPITVENNDSNICPKAFFNK